MEVFKGGEIVRTSTFNYPLLEIKITFIKILCQRIKENYTITKYF